MSRTVVREAVRSLGAKGVIDMRSGSGLRIATVDASAVTESMTLFLRGRPHVDYPRIHEVRSALEVQIARLAAARADARDLAALEAACERMERALGDPEAASREDVEFHRALAAATHNELFLLLLDAIGDVMLEIRRATLGIPGRSPGVLKAHRGILARVTDGDERGAAEAMREHLDDSDRAWLALRAGSAPPPGASAA